MKLRVTTLFCLVVAISISVMSYLDSGNTDHYGTTTALGSSTEADWIVNIRRSTQFGLPNGSTHSSGVSSIVWGYTPDETTLTLTLSYPGGSITRQVTGSFQVSMDRVIKSGDILTATDGVNTRIIHVPEITYTPDYSSKIITGTSPSDVVSIVPGSPHSLQILLPGVTRQITTDSAGNYIADFSDQTYLAGKLGAIRYVTPEGDSIYQPMFLVDLIERGVVGDGWADVVLGKPDFSEIVFNEVVNNHLFNPQGVHIDRSTRPNRLYVYDAGNSRVLGMSYLGICAAGDREDLTCSTDSDCPSSTCTLLGERSADIVLGQSSFSTSACNGDGGFQLYPDVPLATANTLCGLREEQMSISEGGSGTTMATDPQGNLYIPDFFNNRILRYNDPFETDTIADHVWGQADFAGIFCNRGGYAPNASSLCLAPPPGIGDLRSGVAIDPAGNLWVTDTQNNRVLRFPSEGGIPINQADLVLGQSNFTSRASGTELNQMRNPASIIVNNEGVVYVADSLNNRVLIFTPPFSNGMYASGLLGGGLQRPTGMGLGTAGDMWVNDNGNNRFVHYVGGIAQEVIYGVDEEAGLGIDQDGNVYSAGWALQSVLRHTAPTYPFNGTILTGEPNGIFNQTTQRSLYGGHGLEITSTQLIVGDESRLLFWNNPQSLYDYRPADGVIGAPDFTTRSRWGQRYQRMRADDSGRLWVIYKNASGITYIHGYLLPLENGEAPAYQISPPIPILGGGEFTWSQDFLLSGIDVQAECDCLWLSDEGYNRAFRIRNVSTNPMVDIILGQPNASSTACNQGLTTPSADTLCHPGPLAIDVNGNFFLADHNLEFDGNRRLLEWDAEVLPANPSVVIYGIPASRVFGRDDDFTMLGCLSLEHDPICGPWEPAFNSLDNMVLGFNGYLGPRFPMVYLDPLENPFPISALGDFQSMPLTTRYDQYGNLYVIDHNRSRVLVYWMTELQRVYLPITIR